MDWTFVYGIDKMKYYKINTNCTKIEFDINRNKPKKLFDIPICGNGFVESGEECDCGSSERCVSDNCCDPETCRLRSNAECGTGDCCNFEVKF